MYKLAILENHLAQDIYGEIETPSPKVVEVPEKIKEPVKAGLDLQSILRLGVIFIFVYLIINLLKK